MPDDSDVPAAAVMVPLGFCRNGRKRECRAADEDAKFVTHGIRALRMQTLHRATATGVPRDLRPNSEGNPRIAASASLLRDNLSDIEDEPRHNSTFGTR